MPTRKPDPVSALRISAKSLRREVDRKLKSDHPELRDPQSPIRRVIAILDAQERHAYRSDPHFKTETLADPYRFFHLAAAAKTLLRRSAVRKAVAS